MTWYLWFMIGTALGLKLGYDRGKADAAEDIAMRLR